jgi:hypothetical protein
MSIEETLAKLLSEVNAKAAELRANETQRVASERRLDDALKAEATAAVSLRHISTALEKAKTELAEVQRSVKQISADAAKAREQILQKAHREAAAIVEAAEQAVDAAANLIKRKPAA